MPLTPQNKDINPAFIPFYTRITGDDIVRTDFPQHCQHHITLQQINQTINSNLRSDPNYYSFP